MHACCCTCAGRGCTWGPGSRLAMQIDVAMGASEGCEPGGVCLAARTWQVAPRTVRMIGEASRTWYVAHAYRPIAPIVGMCGSSACCSAAEKPSPASTVSLRKQCCSAGLLYRTQSWYLA